MSKKRILVADDEPSVLEITGRMLVHLGYEAEMSSRGIEALERFLAEPETIDLVITDVRMPGIDGVELARRVLEMRPDVPVIFCSGLLEPADAEKQRAGGVRAVLSKPVRLRELKAAVQSALNRKGDSGPSS
jgi:CheY-like chemotaxis protein